MKTIKQILTYDSSLVRPFNFQIAKTGNVIFSDADVRSIFRVFRSWFFDTDETEDNAVYIDFTTLWTTWLNRNIDSIEKVMNGWNADYNAIENFDKRIEGSSTVEHHKGTKTSTNVDISVNGGGTHTEQNKQTNSRNAFNGGMTPTDETSGLQNENGSTDTNNSTTTGNASTNYTTVEDIDGSHFDKDVSTYNGYREHGNIGIQTAASMLLSELSLRRQDVITTFVTTFIKEYCYYVSWTN